jgi:hypothetical protein
MKTTRRELGIAAAAAAMAVASDPADAQTPPPPVQEANRRNSETLTKFEIPISTEPAFRFEP